MFFHIYRMLLVLIISTSCAIVNKNQFLQGNIDPEFKPYLEDFIFAGRGKFNIANLKGLSITFKKVSFAKHNKYTLAVCYYKENKIYVDPNKWKTLSPNSKMVLIWHELGHCVLKRPHLDYFHNYYMHVIERSKVEGYYKGAIPLYGFMEDGCSVSVMNSELISDYCINRNLNYYRKELYENITLFVSENKIGNCNNDIVLINKTKVWTFIDNVNFNSSRKQCLDEKNSCLSKFSKTDKLTYEVVCK